MNWLRTSLLLCGCIPFGIAEEAATVSTEATSVTPEESKEPQAADNLLQRNPFVPFKSGKSFAENIDVSSDFDFLSVVSALLPTEIRSRFFRRISMIALL